ncbi:hypothetical protein [Streptomyces sp. RK76]|uniref:hypothetical protein n=1 Tax=Streptomyces sp. RK76 TaxID=2824896 RepID=UPI001B36514C|nr:hypothetical protein [Streptomyces sp. RK76]MBQ0947676.1 hypothetical protein [Streptomyces sp. RK76]
MTPKQAVPDALAPVLAAVLAGHPAAGPGLLARLVVAELRDLGWHITATPISPTRSIQ